MYFTLVLLKFRKKCHKVINDFHSIKCILSLIQFKWIQLTYTELRELSTFQKTTPIFELKTKWNTPKHFLVQCYLFSSSLILCQSFIVSVLSFLKIITILKIKNMYKILFLKHFLGMLRHTKTLPRKKVASYII